MTEIDLDSLLFGGLVVRVRGNKGPLCTLDDINDDDELDLVCQFEDDDTNWVPGVGDATLTGMLLDGTDFEGTDSICVVPWSTMFRILCLALLLQGCATETHQTTVERETTVIIPEPKPSKPQPPGAPSFSSTDRFGHQETHHSKLYPWI